MKMEPSDQLTKLFGFVDKNNEVIANRFYNELFVLCPDIEFKFKDIRHAMVFKKVIEVIRRSNSDELKAVGREHKKLKGLQRRHFSYVSTCIFSTLIDTCHFLLTKDVIRELNTYVDRAVYLVYEGFLQEA